MKYKTLLRKMLVAVILTMTANANLTVTGEPTFGVAECNLS